MQTKSGAAVECPVHGRRTPRTVWNEARGDPETEAHTTVL